MDPWLDPSWRRWFINNFSKEYLGLALIIALMFLIPAYGSGTWIFIGRIGLVVLLLGSGWFYQPQLALIPGIFAIPADLWLIMDSPTSIDFLLWACYIGVPYGVSVTRGRTENPTSSEKSSSTKTARENHELPSIPRPDETNSSESHQRIKQLLKQELKRAHQQQGAETVLLYDVQNSRANLFMAIDPHEIVNRSLEFRADQGQGIGWVLRHEEELTQRGSQIDWRNLQYRTRGGDLGQVSMIPIHVNNKLAGVFVFEWETEPETEKSWDPLVERLGQIYALRAELQELEKNQDVFQLMTRLRELNPLEESRFDSMIHRSLEMVEEFIPVDEGHVEFFSYTEQHDSSGVIHQGHRAVYEECMKRIQETNELLRIDDLKQHPLGSRLNRRFSAEEIRSFLGGAVIEEGDLVGMICLDHPESGFFTQSDTEILRMLLNQLSQVLQIGREREAIQRQVEEYRTLLESFQNMNHRIDRSLEEFLGPMVEDFHEILPVRGVGFYRYYEGNCERAIYQGAGSPSEYLDQNHMLTRRIRNAEMKTSLLSFPDLRRFDNFEAPLESEALAVAPVVDGNDLIGFFTFFVNQSEKLDDALFEEFNRLLPLLSAPLGLMKQRDELRISNNLDSITDQPTFDEWKRKLRMLSEDRSIENLVLWFVRIPGYEKIAVERGRDRANNWIRSVSELLEEELSHSEFARLYTGTFIGYEVGQAEKIRERLTTIMKKISSWSFPAGNWPSEPKSNYKRFSPPLPSVRKLIEAPFYAGEGAERSERNSKQSPA